MEDMPLQEIYKEPTKKEWMAFVSLLFVQSQNAMNEKATQFLLLPLGAIVLANGGSLEYILGALILLPYILFSPLVGWMADRFCRTWIVRVMAMIQVLVMIGICVSLYCKSITAAVLCFAVFATQTTILSPARKGIVKDMLGTKYMGFASGLVEMTNIFALLVGQIGVFTWISYLQHHGHDIWSASDIPAFWMCLSGVVVVGLTFIIPRYPVLDKKKFRWSLLFEHFAQVKEIFSNRRLLYCEMGISFFWFFGGAILLIVLELAKNSHSYATQGALLNAWMSGGVVLGGIFVSYLSRKGIRLGFSAPGALLMALSCFALGWFDLMTMPFYLSLAVAGFSGSLFFVPLNAYFQDRSDNAKRGNIIAAGNLIDMMMSLGAVAFQLILNRLDVSVSHQFVIMGILCALMYVLVYRIMSSRILD